jgi:endonuclease YncB( thermonuclease family)
MINILSSLIILTCIKETVSGDTIILTNLEKVRLIEIQAPEIPYDKQARDVLNSKIFNKLIKLKRIEGKPTKGELWVDKQNINEYMVREGWAKALNSKRMSILEQEAKNNHKGVWKWLKWLK